MKTSSGHLFLLPILYSSRSIFFFLQNLPSSVCNFFPLFVVSSSSLSMLLPFVFPEEHRHPSRSTASSPSSLWTATTLNAIFIPSVWASRHHHRLSLLVLGHHLLSLWIIVATSIFTSSFSPSSPVFASFIFLISTVDVDAVVVVPPSSSTLDDYQLRRDIRRKVTAPPSSLVRRWISFSTAAHLCVKCFSSGQASVVGKWPSPVTFIC